MSYDNLFWGDIDTPNHSQWRIKAESILADRDIFHPTPIKYFPLGAIADSRDGRRWRYCEKDGTNALVKAKLIGACLGTANWQTELQTYGTAFVLGDKVVNVFVQDTAAAHTFIDGYLTVEDGTGQDEMYLIKDNEIGVTATGGFTIKVHIADAGGVRAVTLATTGTEITLTKNKYKDLLIVANNVVGVVIGVPLVAVPVDNFFWAQTRGPCPILADASETIIVGDWLMASEATPGTVDILDASSAVDNHPVGVAMAALTATAAETVLVDLRLE